MSVAACFDRSQVSGHHGGHSEFMAIEGAAVCSTSRQRCAASSPAGPWRGRHLPSITASASQKQPTRSPLEPRARLCTPGAVLTASSDGAMEATLTLRTVFTTGGTLAAGGTGIVERSRHGPQFTGPSKSSAATWHPSSCGRRATSERRRTRSRSPARCRSQTRSVTPPT